MMVDYSPVTEVPGIEVTRENLAMAVSRYALAATLATDADVLEVGCGGGQGLGWLAGRARRVVGGDYTAGLLSGARGHYGDRVPLVRLDGENLPFREACFDLVVMLEAIYYLPNPGRFARECRRVLRPGGSVLVCTVNPAWADFNPSPLSTRYLAAPELADTLRAAGFEVSLSAAFPWRSKSATERVLSLVKRLAVTFRLVPRTMKRKVLLKRLFLGPLVRYPRELREESAPAALRYPLAATDDTSGFKVIYALGRCAEPV